MRIQSLLGIPSAYRAWRSLVLGRGQAEYVRDYLRLTPGDRVLDVGCGTGEILSALPPVDYHGIDLSPRYVEAARRRWGGRARFTCASVAETAVREPASYDLVMANGVLHHLSDQEVRLLLALARRALKPGGRLVTADGCFEPGQSPVARWLLRRDRGRFVRTRGGYVALAQQVFPSVAAHVRHDLLRIPYTHLIMVARAA
jgi:SAM-dependent methyltransferase